MCEYEDIKLMPGTASNNNSKCISIFCNEDYSIEVQTCEVEVNPKCKPSHNFRKPFPDCCNQFCQSITQLDE